MRKVIAGRCGLCGRAVEILDVDPGDAVDLFWLGGHLYVWSVLDRAWRLESVRCDSHASDATDPRAQWSEVHSE